MTIPPFETVRPNGDPAILLVCDHASNRVSEEIGGGDLGLPARDMNRHIAYDVGARGVTLGLSELLNAPAVMSTFSRLVIDPNRGEDDPTLVMKISDRSVIPANRHVDAAEIRRRRDAYHRPYHGAITAAIDRAIGAGVSPALISMHSFTPRFNGRPIRPWHVGVLWDRDDRLSAPLIARLRLEHDLVVGDNEPYSGQLAGDCMWLHGTSRGLNHTLIEIRNDLIETEAQQREWAERLAQILREVLDGLDAGAPAAPEPAAHGVAPSENTVE